MKTVVPALTRSEHSNSLTGFQKLKRGGKPFHIFQLTKLYWKI